MCGDAEQMFRPLFKPWAPWEEIPSDDEDEADALLDQLTDSMQVVASSPMEVIDSDAETVDGTGDVYMDETQLEMFDFQPAASATPEDVPLSIFCMCCRLLVCVFVSCLFRCLFVSLLVFDLSFIGEDTAGRRDSDGERKSPPSRSLEKVFNDALWTSPQGFDRLAPMSPPPSTCTTSAGTSEAKAHAEQVATS